jgi:hypothetical protein
MQFLSVGTLMSKMTLASSMYFISKLVIAPYAYNDILYEKVSFFFFFFWGTKKNMFFIRYALF